MKTTATFSCISAWISRILLCGALFAVTFFSGGNAQAQTYTWSGPTAGTTAAPTSGTWINGAGADWNTGTTYQNYTNNTANNVVFGGTSSGAIAVTVGGGITANQLQFTSTSDLYTLSAASAQTISLSNNNVFTPNTGGIEVATGVTATIGSNVLLYNSANLDVTSTTTGVGGTLALVGGGLTANDVVIDNATVVVGNGGSLTYTSTGSGAGNGIFVGNTAADVNSSLILNTGGMINGNTTSGGISWVGVSNFTTPQTNTGTASLIINGGTANFNTLAVGYTGTYSAGANSQYVQLNGGTLNISVHLTGSGGGGNASAFFFNGGTLTSIGATGISFMQNFINVYVGGNTTLGTGAVINNGGFAVTIAQNLVTGAGITNSTTPASMTDGGLVSMNSGTLTLTGTNNTYTGGTQITQGAVEFTNTGTMPTTGTVAVSSGATLDVGVGGTGYFSNATSGVGSVGGLLNGTATGTGTGGSVTYGSSVTVGLDTTNATGSAFSYAGNIANAGANTLGLAKLGTGTLTLTGTDTYTGNTTISAGTLIIGTAGLMSSATAGTYAGAIKDNGAFIYNSSANDTLTGAITGSGSVTENSSGTLVLSGTSNYSGATTVTAGNLNITGSVSTSGVTISAGTTTLTGTLIIGTGGLAITGNALTINGGTLQSSGAFSITGSAPIVGASGVTINTSGGTISDSNATSSAFFSGSGTITVTGGGDFNLSSTQANNSAFNGSYIVTGGSILTINQGQNLGTANGAANYITLNNGTLQFSANLGAALNNSRNITLASSTTNTIDTETFSTNTAVGGVITGSGNLTKVGTGTLFFQGANTYTGATTIDAGTINVSVIPGANSGALTFNGTGTYTTSVSETVGGVNLASGVGTVIETTNGSTFTLGAITQASTLGMVQAVPSGTANISTTTGNVNGIIAPWAFNGTGTSLAYSIGGGNIANYASGTALPTGGPGSNTANYTLGAAASLTGNVTGYTLQYTGAGAALGLGTSSLTLDGLMNTGSGLLTISGGSSAGLVTGTNNLTNAAQLDIISDSNGITISSVVSGTGALVYGGPSGGTGTLTLSGANLYSGGTYVNSGILQLGSTTALGSTSGSLNVAAGGTVNLAGFSQTVGALNGASVGSLIEDTTVGAATLTVGQGGGTGSFAGIITNGGQTLSFTKTGAGSQTLSGNNTYTGATTVSTGTLVLSGSNTGATGLTTVSGGATLTLVSNALNTTGGISYALPNNTLVASSGSSTVQLLSNSSVTFNGATGNGYNQTGSIQGGTITFYVANNGSGTNQTIGFDAGNFTFENSTLDVTGANGYTLALGTMVTVYGGGSYPSTITPTTASVTIAGFTAEQTLDLDGTSTGNSIGAIGEGGGNGITKSNTSTWTLTGTNTYTTPTTISGGTLIVGGSGDLGSGYYAGAISNAGTFNYNSSVNQVLAGVLSGAGTFAESGPGTLTLTGTNTYTGPTTIAAASTLFIGSSGQLNSGTYAGAITDSGTFNFASAAAQTLTGTFTGSGGGQDTGIGGAALVDSGAGTLTLADTAQLTAQLYLNAGKVILASAGTYTTGNNSGSITMGGGNLQLGDSSGGVTTSAHNLIFSGTGSTISSGTGHTSTITLNSGTVGSGSDFGAIQVANGTTGTIGAGVTVQDGNEFDLDTTTGTAGGVLDVYGTITGTGIESIDGITLNVFTGGTLNGANFQLLLRGTDSATVDVEGGTLTTSGNLVVGNGSTNASSTSASVATLIVGGPSGGLGGIVTAPSTGLQIAGGNNTSGVTGKVFLNGGTITTPSVYMGSTGTATAVSYFFFNGGTLTASAGSATFMTGLTHAYVGGNATLGTGAVINNNGNGITIGQNLVTGLGVSGSTNTSGADGGLVSLGAGTLILTGTNTYTGGTSISAGTLEFANTAAMPTTGTVAVASGTTLDIGVGAGTTYFSNTTTNTAGAVGGILNGTATGTGTGGSVTYGSSVKVGLDTTNATSGAFSYAGNIANAGANTLGLIKLGAGTLTLSGNDSYTGTTLVSAGTLALSGSNTAATGTVTVNSGTTLQLQANNNNINGTTSAALGTANISIQGGATVSLLSNSSVTFSSGSSSNNINSTTVTFNVNNNGSGTNNTISFLTGGFGTADTTYDITGGNGYTLALGTMNSTYGGGSYFLTINPVGASVTVAGINGQSATVTLSGTSTGNSVGTINDGATGTSLVKSGTSTWTLTGTNTYTSGTGETGTTTISGGTLIVGGSGLLSSTATPGTYAGAIANSTTFIYNSSAADTLSGPITGAGVLTDNGAGTLTLAGADTYTGATSVTNGTLAIASTGSVSGIGSSITTSGTGIVTEAAGGVIGGATNTFTQGSSGTSVLSGTNTYGGTTTINAGTLKVNGSTAAGSAVAVNAGGTLGGTGTVNGAVTVAGGASGAGGSIVLGNTLGTDTLALSNGLTLGGTGSNYSNLNFQVAASSSDKLAITGALTVNAGGADITITNEGLDANVTYVLASFSGAGTYSGSAFTQLNTPLTTVDGFTLLNPSFLSFGVSGTLEITAASNGLLELVTTGNVAPTTAYWKGANGSAWNSFSGTNGNFTTDNTGNNFVQAYPNSSSTVIFDANGATNLSNSLGQAFSVMGLQFLGVDASSTPINAINITDATYGLTVGSGGITDANTNGVTLATAAVVPGANQTWTNSSGATLAVTAPITGAAATSTTTTLTISDTAAGATNLNGIISNGSNGGNLALTINSSGAGVTTLGNANTYTGGTTLVAGNLALGNASGLSTGSVTVNAGTLNLAGFSPTITNLQGSGGTILNNGAADTLTVSAGNYAGVIANGTGALALTKSGAGTLTLSGNETYTGATSVSVGTLALSGSNSSKTGLTTVSGGAILQLQANSNNINGTTSAALGTTNSDLVLNSGATLSLLSNSSVTFGGGTGTNGYNGQGSMQGGVYTFYVANNGSGTNQTISFDPSGMDAVNQTFYINGANGYTLALGTIDSSIYGGGPYASSIIPTVNVTIAGLTSNKGYTLDGTSTGNVITGAITEGYTGSFITKSNTSTWTLSGINTYTGGTSITGGTLIVGGSGDLGSGTYAGAIADTATFIYNSSANQTLSGAITGTAGQFIQSGSGVTILSGTNTYTGGTSITGGTLEFANTSAMPSTGTVTVGSGTTLAVGVGGTGYFSNTTTNTAGAVGGLLNGTSTGTGSGGVAVNYASNVTFGFDTTNATGGTFTYTPAITNASVGATTLGLTKLGAGTLVLTGNNGYTGATLVRAGTLALTGSNTAVTGLTTVASGATLQLQANAGNTNGSNVSAALGTGILVLNSGGSTLQLLSNSSVTFSGTTGTGGYNSTGVFQGSSVTFYVANNGSGTNNTISFDTTGLTLEDSTLNVAGANGYTLALGTINGDYGGGPYNTRIFPVGASVTVAGFTDPDNLTLGGTSTGNSIGNITSGAGGGLTKSNTSTWTLNGNDTYSGGTTVNGGTLNANSATALGLTTNTLTVSSSDSPASGPVVLNLNTATTTVGSLSGSTGNGLNTATINIASNDTLIVNQTASRTFAGVIAGSGVFTLGSLSTATLEFSGVNTYSGGTTLLAGTLDFGPVGTLGNINNSLTMSATATLDLEGTTQNVGALNGVSGATITDLGNINASTDMLIVGNGNASGSYAGSIQDGNGFGTALEKVGSGTQVLSGTASQYSGGTTILGGILQVTDETSIGNAGNFFSGDGFGAFPFGQLTLSGGELLTTGSTPTFVSAVSLNTSATTNTLAAATGTTATYSGTIADLSSGGVLTIGDALGNNGAVELTNANTYSGGTTITAGTLIAGIGSTGSITNGPFGTGAVTLGSTNTSSPNPTLLNPGFTIANPIIVANFGGTDTIAGSGTATYTGNVTLAKAVTLQAATGGTTDFNTGAWTTGNNAITVGSTGNAGTVELDSAVATSGGIAVNYGTLNSTAAITAPVSITGSAIITQTSTGTLTGNVNDSSTSTTNSLGGVFAGGGSTLTVSAGKLTISGGTLANTDGGLTTVSGGELDLDKTAGVNAIAGNVLVSNTGTLKLINANQIINTSSVTVTGGTLNFNNLSQTLYSLSNSGGLVQYGTGTVTITDPSWSGGTNPITGTTNFGSLDISGGTNTISSSATLTVGGDATGTGLTLSGTGAFTALTDSGTLALSPTAVTGISTATNSGAGIAGLTGSGAATIAGSGTVSLNGAQTINVANSGTSLEIDPTIVDGSATSTLTKSGAGSLIVTGANTYSGGTTISLGTLYANGGVAGTSSATGTGAVTIAGGATLAGTGVIRPTISGAGILMQAHSNLTSGGVPPPVTSGAIAGKGLTLDNTVAAGTILDASIGSANLTFSLGAGNNGLNVVTNTPDTTTGQPEFDFANPNTDSTYMTVLGNTASEVAFATGDTITVNDLTGVNNLQLNTDTPYLLIEAGTTPGLLSDNNLYSGLVTTGGVIGGQLENGYVLNLTVAGTAASENYATRLYLFNGDLEVVPEPSTWAMMLGGLGLLLIIQIRRRRNN